ncbi:MULTISPECIES: TraB/GumN family protein [Salinibaculum]|uniref:TraB/GumN family protein n=1 Tax=Salinibaculum TaxID=2732368 RepID=UPI0030CDC70F
MTESGRDGDPIETETPAPPGEPSGEGSVTVVGTAHVSHESVAEVEETIERERPDVVAVELDENRYRRMQGEAPEDIDAGDLIKGKTVYQFIAYWLLSYIQTRLGERFDIEPGADMKAAVDTAEEVGSGVALVDRDIQLTIQRFWKRMRFREKVSMFTSMAVLTAGPWGVGLGVGFFLGTMVALVGGALAGPFFIPPGLSVDVGVPLLGGVVGLLLTVLDGLVLATLVAGVVGIPIAVVLATTTGDAEDVDEFDIDELTEADVVTAMMEEFRRFSPGGAEALIDERDAFIAHRLVALREAGYSVVAVVGAGHREGIEGYLENPETLPPAESLVGMPDGNRLGSILYKAFGYLFTVGFLVFFVLLAMAGVRQQYLIVLFGAWFLVNGIIAAALAKLAGAHWTSASVGGGVAWLTSVNPLLAPGWFAGYVELRYLDVNVGDISRLNELLSDEETPLGTLFKQMREVPLFRLILIVGMTNVGSFIASILFATVLLPQLSTEIGGVSGLADQMVIGARNSAELIWEVLT